MRGLFLRGYGSQSHSQNNGSTVGVTATLHGSGSLGSIQGGALREIMGKFHTDGLTGQSSGPFYAIAYSISRGLGTVQGEYGTMFDSSRVVPTADENRPVNMAVRYFIRALP